MSNLGRWDLFCKVVDNFGDIGVCWRLARQLAAEHSVDVRLWVDDLQTFARLAPPLSVEAPVQQIEGVEVRAWRPEFPAVEAADVVIEAFACELPEQYLQSMAQRTTQPVWINLEYLSAEPWVVDCHRLKSPHFRYPLTKHFFFPGFTTGTGGLLREGHLLSERQQFDQSAANAFWRDLMIPPKTPGETRVSLFCYENLQIEDLFDCWSDGELPVSVITCDGAATAQAERWLGTPLTPGSPHRVHSLTIIRVPLLSQRLYDRLLWACDVNFVRGEDSFVRAQWAQKPLVWQIYPQDDGAHHVKLNAFLNRYLETFDTPGPVRAFWQAWNADVKLGNSIGPLWQEYAAVRPCLEKHGSDWVGQLDRTGNLADNLIRFVRAE